jgi:hypothetical protein
MVYVVVAAGVTVTEPLVVAIAPIGLIVTAVAFVEVKLSTVEPPRKMVAGSAVTTAVGAGVATGWTTTVNEAVALPPGPVAVMVYVVVAAGVTVTEPLVVAIAPIGLIVTAVAFVEVKFSTLDWPTTMLTGSAVRLAVGARGAGGTTTTVNDAVAIPPGPVAVMM